MFSVADRAQHQFFGLIHATDQLDDDVNRGVVDNAHAVLGQLYVAKLAAAWLLRVAHGDLQDLDSPARASHDLVAIACQHIHGAAAYRAEPEHPNLHRFQNSLSPRPGIGSSTRSHKHLNTLIKGADDSESADPLSIFLAAAHSRV